MFSPVIFNVCPVKHFKRFFFYFKKHPKKLNASSAQWLLTQQRDNDDLNKIVLCVKNGDLDEMKQELLRRYGSEAKIKYGDYLKDGWTLLLHAVSNVQLHVVSYLINKKADVNCEAGEYQLISFS